MSTDSMFKQLHAFVRKSILLKLEFQLVLLGYSAKPLQMWTLVRECLEKKRWHHPNRHMKTRGPLVTIPSSLWNVAEAFFDQTSMKLYWYVSDWATVVVIFLQASSILIFQMLENQSGFLKTLLPFISSSIFSVFGSGHLSGFVIWFKQSGVDIKTGLSVFLCYNHHWKWLSRRSRDYYTSVQYSLNLCLYNFVGTTRHRTKAVDMCLLC